MQPGHDGERSRCTCVARPPISTMTANAAARSPADYARFRFFSSRASFCSMASTINARTVVSAVTQ